MQVSHTLTPSPMCDQRAASSRRLVVAGTAVATRLRATVQVYYIIWSLWVSHICNEQQCHEAMHTPGYTGVCYTLPLLHALFRLSLMSVHALIVQ